MIGVLDDGFIAFSLPLAVLDIYICSLLLPINELHANLGRYTNVARCSSFLAGNTRVERG